mgnify:CR=1 FL=1
MFTKQGQWEDKNEQLVVRLVVSFTTKKEDVDELINFIASNYLK